MIEKLEERALLSITTPMPVGNAVLDANGVDITAAQSIAAGNTVILTIVTDATGTVSIGPQGGNTYQEDAPAPSATKLQLFVFSSYLTQTIPMGGMIQVNYTGSNLTSVAAGAIYVGGLVTPDSPIKATPTNGVTSSMDQAVSSNKVTSQGAEIAIGVFGEAANATINPAGGATVASQLTSPNMSVSELTEYSILNSAAQTSNTATAMATIHPNTTEYSTALVTYQARYPVAAPQAYTVNIGSTIDASDFLTSSNNLLANAMFFGTVTQKSATDASNPLYATSSFGVTSDGNFVYTPMQPPATNPPDSDSFQYTVSDGTLTSAGATVTITIENIPPTVTDSTDSQDATSGAYTLRENRNSGLLKITPIGNTDGPPPAYYEIPVSSVMNGTLYLSDGTNPTTQVLLAGGNNDDYFIAASDATNGLVFEPTTGTKATTAFTGFTVAASTTNNETTAVVGAPTPVKFTIIPPQAPVVTATGTRENPVTGTPQESSTITIAENTTEVGYVNYFKVTIDPSNASGKLNGTLSDGQGHTYNASSGSNYILVPASGMVTLTFEPNDAYSNDSTTDTLFDVAAASTMSDSTAALSTASAVSVLVAPPETVTASDPDTSILANTSTNVTLKVGKDDVGYVNDFEVTTLLNGTLTATINGVPTTFNATETPFFVPVGAGGSTTVTFSPSLTMTGQKSSFGFTVKGATTNTTNAALSPTATSFQIAVTGPQAVTATAPTGTTYVRKNESVPVTLALGAGDTTAYVKYYKISPFSDGSLTYTTDASGNTATDDGSAVVYVPILSQNGTATVIYSPAIGMSGPASMFGFTVVGATAANANAAVSSPATMFNIQVVAPEMPSVSSSAATIDEDTTQTKTSATITLSVGTSPINDQGYVTDFLLTSAVTAGTLTGPDGSGGTRTYSMGDEIPVGPGGTTTLTFTPTLNTFTGAASFTFESAATGAAVGGNEADSGPATISLVVFPVSDLGLSFAQITATQTPNQPFSYTATVTNYGPSPATGVVLTDTFPTNVTRPTTASVTIYHADGTVAQAATLVNLVSLGGTMDSIAITSTTTPALGLKDYAVVTYTVTPTTSAFGGALLNVATVAHDATEHEPANDATNPNTASVAVQIAGNLIVTDPSDNLANPAPGSLRFILNELATLSPPPAGQSIPITFDPSKITGSIILNGTLPIITQFVTIYGGTPNGVVTIDGRNLASGSIFTFGTGSDGSTIQSLKIIASNTARAAIEVDAGSKAPIQVFNDILVGGGSPSSSAKPAGVLITGSTANALISQNTQISGFYDGVDIVGSSNNVIQSDTIGTLDPATTPGNAIGIMIDGSSTGNIIGASPAPAQPPATSPYSYATDNALGNTIAYNTINGVVVLAGASATNNSIRANSIYQNGPAGNSTGINDQDPQSGMISTTLMGASLFGSNATNQMLTVNFTVTLKNPSPEATNYVVDFYSQSVSNPLESNLTMLNPLPEGRIFLGSAVITIGPNSVTATASFMLDSARATLVQANQFITATTTLVQPSSGPTTYVGDTSDFSAPIIISNGLIVTNTLDSLPGNPDIAGSLRAAIDDANQLTTPATIVFNLAPGTNTIKLDSPLPAITANVTIDASPAQELQALAKVEILGSAAALDGKPELMIAGGTVTIRGLIFDDPNGPAILVGGSASTPQASTINATIVENTINDPSNGGFADILVAESSKYSSNVTIGGTGLDANTINDNLTTTGSKFGEAIDLEAPTSGTAMADVDSITGNTIILSNAQAVAAIGYGILVDGVPNVSIAGNTILGGPLVSGAAISVENVHSTALGVTIANNVIGPAASNKATGGAGILISNALDTLVQGNTITNVGDDGISVGGGSLDTNLVANSITGTGAGGGAGLGIEVSGSIATGMVDTSGTTIIGGSVTGGVALGIGVFTATDTSISGVAVSGNDHGGVSFQDVADLSMSRSVVSGSTITGNGDFGVSLLRSSDLTIGGAAPTDRDVISGNSGVGVMIQDASNNDRVQGNYIGIDDGGTKSGNTASMIQATGVEMTTTTVVGTGDSITGNVISGNSQYGVDLQGSSDVAVTGNMIGTNAVANGAVPNGMAGVRLTGTSPTTGKPIPAGTISNNTIAGNTFVGLLISGYLATGETIQGNDIGTDGQEIGIDLAVQGGMIGGTGPGQGNVVSGNSLYGIELFDSSDVTLAGNKIGTDAAGDAAIPNGTGPADAGVYVTGLATAGITIGGSLAGSGNVISGNEDSGILVSGVGTTAPTIQGNLIGTDSMGMRSLGTQMTGIDLIGVSLGTIGGTTSRAGNTISGNLHDGIDLADDSGVGVEGNLISANGFDGIMVSGTPATAGSNTIGGASGSGNVITANQRSGIVLTAGANGTLIQGNAIGITLGELASGNIGDGISLTGVSGVQVVGNAVAANLDNGIEASGTTSLLISGNFIGTGLHGAPLGNQQSGIVIEGNTVDGPGLGISHNQVDSNGRDGIDIENIVNGLDLLDNSIGVLGVMTSANKLDGVLIAAVPTSASSGFSVALGGNAIAGNGLDGLQLAGARGVIDPGNVNFIEGNQSNGIELSGGSTSDAFSGDVVLGNKTEGVLIGAGSSANAFQRLMISGNLAGGLEINSKSAGNVVSSGSITGNGGDGLAILNSDDTTVASEKVTGNIGAGFSISSSNGTSIASGTVASNGGDGLSLTLSGGTKLQGVAVVGNGGNGLTLTSSDGTVDQGGVVADNVGDGVSILDSANTVVSGVVITGNSGNGVALQQGSPTSVGSSNTLLANLGISGNGDNGILVGGVHSSGNFITGDFIGASSADGISLLNAGTGNVIGGNTQVTGNVGFGIAITGTNGSVVAGDSVSMNLSNGVVISGQGPFGTTPGNRIYDNTLDANKLDGVVVLGSIDNTIGYVGLGNSIDHNGTDGVAFFNGSNDNAVVGNAIGTSVGNLGDGIHVVASNDNIIQGNVDSANKQSGVEIFGYSVGNEVIGNTLGTLTTSQPLLGNQLNGVLVAGSSLTDTSTSPQYNYIGVTPEGTPEGNFISGNQSNGVVITLAAHNLVMHNVIAGNAVDGVSLSGDSGDVVEAGNTIVLNKGDGIGLGASNGAIINSNAISSNGNGVDAVGSNGSVIRSNQVTYNSVNGIAVIGSNGSTIATNQVQGNLSNGIVLTTALSSVVQGNVIAGNQADGITLTTSGLVVGMGNAIQGNVIANNQADGLGLTTSDNSTITGNAIQGNAAEGIRARLGSDDNQIGMAGSQANIITNNTTAGIEVNTSSTGNAIQSNVIGFSYPGAGGQPQSIGVYLNNVSSNTVGGTSLLVGANTITGNANYGVFINGNGPATSTSATPVGNQVLSNYIGTNSQGEAPSAYPSGISDVGVFVINSTKNAIDGDVISGNHAAGIELFGAQSSNNTIGGDTIGSDLTLMRPILTTTDPSFGPTIYTLYNRQDYGVWINGAGSTSANSANDVAGNAILGNNILGNMDGVYVQGSTAVGDTIQGNNIGQVLVASGTDNPLVAAGYDKLNGLGNVTGVYIANTGGASVGAGDTIIGNTIDRNLLTGVSIVGPAASDNVVQHNIIGENGGFGALTADRQSFALTPATPGTTIFPSAGVYIESGSGNIIGANPTNPASSVAAEGNTISDNTVAGVYVFNFGTLANNPNLIEGNTISGDDSTANPPGNYDPYLGEYGVLLYNSSGNINGVPAVPGLASSPAYPNTYLTSPAFTIASYREYTGGATPPPLIVPGTTTVKAGSVNVQAESVEQPATATVTATVVGKGHPLPPSRKGFLKKS